MTTIIPQIPADIRMQVKQALQEDIGTGDITATLLLSDAVHQGRIICNEAAIICGQPWVNEVYAQLDPDCQIEWRLKEGQQADKGTECALIAGPTQALLTGERTALNFLQLLSSTATTSQHYSQLIAHTQTQLLDTRKTIPGLRTAQKYAVACGGGHNHRMGLFDAFLIKENHILAVGGICQAIKAARLQAPMKTLEIEVENLTELEQALAAKPDIIMLDNFSIDNIKAAVALNAGQVKLEVSGGITNSELIEIAETGVDYISVGALTKNIQAVDLSFRIQ